MSTHDTACAFCPEPITPGEGVRVTLLGDERTAHRPCFTRAVHADNPTFDRRAAEARLRITVTDGEEES